MKLVLAIVLFGVPGLDKRLYDQENIFINFFDKISLNV